jgi:hypothetical protein
MKPSCGGKGSSRLGYGLFRKLAIVLASTGLLLASPGVFQGVAGAAAPAPPFTECPAVGYNTSCSLLVDVTGSGNLVLQDPHATVSGDPLAGTYDGVDDTLIGIINNSSVPVSHVTLSSNAEPLFGFDGDGICQDPNSTSGSFGLHCNGVAHQINNPNYNNPHDSTGYGGNDAFFTNISSDFMTGTVNFFTPIPPGGTDYFSLEEKLDIPDFCQDTITLAPTSATSVVGGPAQTFTATILDLGTPAAGIAVTFTVSSGPNAGQHGSAVTDVNGQAQFVDPSSATAGTDSVVASYHDPTCTNPPTHSSAPSTMTWTKASPTITTQASPTAITVGTPTTVGDMATFHNTVSGVPPTQPVTFTLYSNNTCTTPAGVTGSEIVHTTAGVSTAMFTRAGFSAPAAGTYYWVASYPGDSGNNPFTSACGAANEVVAVAKASPSITTQATPTSMTVGTPTTVSDTATFVNTTSVAPTGSVTFTLYANNACTASTGVTGSGAISTTGGVSTATFSTPAFTAPAAGTYYWQASYAGDANNNPISTACGAANEVVAVGLASPTITTQAGPTSITVGTPSTVGDTATFQNTTSVAPTGSVSFTLYSNNACTASTGVSGSAAISTTAGVSSASFSTSFTAPATGTYYWRATYAGDANNNPITPACGAANEVVAVGLASPSITTQAGPTSITVGAASTVGDTATFVNTTSVAPTGSVTFTLYKDNTCTTAAGVTGSGPISTSMTGVSTATFSSAFTAPALGTYYWRATYAGDANNNPASTACGAADEVLGVGLASPTIVTQASPASITVGTASTVGDLATFQNTTSAAPTGSVTFTLYTDNACTAPAGVAGVGGISTTAGVSTASFSTGWIAPQTGTYYWQASYAGDANNNAFTEPCAAATELIVVNPGSPSITTQANPTQVSVGVATAVGDAALFSGTTLVAPTGSVTFTLYANNTCTAPAGVTGNGAIHTAGGVSTASFSAAWAAPAPGTYYWRATYAGDRNNDAFTTGCGDAGETVIAFAVKPSGAYPTSVTTSLSALGASGGNISVAAGTPVSDSATLQGANVSAAGGMVTYSVYSDANCRTLVASGGTEAVSAGSVEGSDPIVLNVPGKYYWQVTYSGDALNGGSTSACGSEIETALPLDHFLCYSSRPSSGATFQVPGTVQLTNDFSPNGFVPKIGEVDFDCNPVQKTVPTGVTKVTNPSAHLVCWHLSAPSSNKTVVVTNQFGRATLKTGGTAQVCLPSWQQVGSPPNNPSSTPSGLSHFTCYSASYAPHGGSFKPPKSVTVKDEFSNQPVKVKVGAPKLLCLPTAKTVNGVTYPELNPLAQLMCLAVTPTPTKNPVYDQNQFGTGKVQVTKTGTLCLPSTKLVVGP